MNICYTATYAHTEIHIMRGEKDKEREEAKECETEHAGAHRCKRVVKLTCTHACSTHKTGIRGEGQNPEEDQKQ